MMKENILHELSSPIPYLRWRAVWFYRQYDNFNIPDMNHLLQLVDSVNKSLYDQFLVVRYEAALTLPVILGENMDAIAFLRPDLHNLVQ
jgi:hypothetical protein